MNSRRYSLLTFGRWDQDDDVAAEVLRWVNRWMEEEERPLERVYVCPLCGYVAHKPRGSLFKPRCPLHYRVEMMWYVPRLVEEDDKLFEKFRDLLDMKLMVLEVAARRYAGKPPDEWRLYAPPAVELAFLDNPSFFKYAWWHNRVEVYLHRLDQEFLSYLKKAVVDHLALELRVEINPHAAEVPPNAVYDEEKGVYRIVEKPL